MSSTGKPPSPPAPSPVRGRGGASPWIGGLESPLPRKGRGWGGGGVARRPGGGEGQGHLLRLCQGLLQVGDEVADGFEADGEADIIRGDARGLLGVLVELGVGCGSRVDDEGLGVSQVSQMGEVFTLSIRVRPESRPPFIPKPRIAPKRPSRRTSSRSRRLGGRGGRGIDPGHLWVLREETGDLVGVLGMAFHAERQRLHA